MSHKFKDYNQQQNWLLPPCIEEMIPPDQWLSNKQVADHNTIAHFRSKKLKSVFKDIFKQVVLLLAQEGLVTLKQVYTDGTKIESVAGRSIARIGRKTVWGAQ